MSIAFEDLSDFSAFNKMASSLWRSNNEVHGLTLMVGAGFSRSAATVPEDKYKPPLWSHLSRKLADDLGSANTNDPLKLAEVYNVYFGKKALYDLIQNEVNDSIVKPSILHERLLQLPWVDVMTTNWDTLLERASRNIYSPVYDIVKSQEDFANTKSPRIVKLHGSIDGLGDLVFTQEDYRLYPQNNAAFVNFARQAFIENELCLIGFSGDDPNFLQWVGWVRDHLSSHVRRIYIVGPLDLDSSQRKYLESINIAPIDLSNLVLEYDSLDAKHEAANRLLIEKLISMRPEKPWKWNPIANICKLDVNSSDSREIDECISEMKKERLSYPGWLICPKAQRNNLSEQTSYFAKLALRVKGLNIASKSELLYEICWRYSITFNSPPKWLFDEILNIILTDEILSLSKHQVVEMYLVLLKSSFLDVLRNDVLQEKRIVERIASLSSANPKTKNEILFINLCLARGRVDYKFLQRNIDDILELEPVWKLRKAALLIEVGEHERSKYLVKSALKELRSQFRDNQRSVYILSRLAWADVFIRSFQVVGYEQFIDDVLLSKIKEMLCDPFDEISHIESVIDFYLEDQRKKFTIEPMFSPGAYKDLSKSITYRSGVHPFFMLYGLDYTSVVPIRNGNSLIYTRLARKLARLDTTGIKHKFILLVRSINAADDQILNIVFSRVAIACLEESEILYIKEACLASIDYWLNKRVDKSLVNDTTDCRNIGIFLEILSRVTIRFKAEHAKEIFLLGIELSQNKQLHNYYVSTPLGNLLNISMKCMSVLDRQNLLYEIINFPLKSEVSKTVRNSWPQLVLKDVGERVENINIDKRMQELIGLVKSGCQHSADSLDLLIVLYKEDYLKESETLALANNIWCEVKSLEELPEVGFYDYVLLDLPVCGRSYLEVRKSIKSRLYGSFDIEELTYVRIKNVIEAAKIKNIYPSSEQACKVFDEIISQDYENHKLLSDLHSFDSGRNIMDLYGSMLALCIVPAIHKSELDDTRFNQLIEYYNLTNLSGILSALVQFVGDNESRSKALKDILKVNLLSKDSSILLDALKAVKLWIESGGDISTSDLIARIVYSISTRTESGLYYLLFFANQLEELKVFSSQQLNALIDSLPIIFDSMEYSNNLAYDIRSIDESLIRAECVSLSLKLRGYRSSNLEGLKSMLIKAKDDPLPEVRKLVREDIIDVL